MLNQALAHLQAQRGAEAEPLIDALMQRTPDDVNLLFFKGGARLLQDDAAGALTALEAACSRAPGHAMIESARGRALFKLDRYSEAREAFQRALAAQPGFSEARFMLGETLDKLGERTAAIEAYRHAAQDPARRGEALAKAALALHAAGNADEAARCAADAVAAAPHDANALGAWAQIALDAGEHATVAQRLQHALDARAWSNVNEAILAGLLGEALDKHDQTAPAFTAYARANAALAREHGPHQAGRAEPMNLDYLRQLRAAIAQLDADAYARTDQFADEAAPVFLVGFPRSGTTLLDQILSGHPEIEVVEETDNLTRAAKLLISDPSAFQHRLSTISEHDVSSLRADYLKSFAARRKKPNALVAIDKYPLLLNLAPVIRTLWPRARFILALRDPRDAVLSAFQQRFTMNAAMFAMLRLETAAAYYDASMALFSDLRAKAALCVHETRYEDVVRDLGTSARAILDYLKLDWNEAVLDHQATARSRSIKTPSARQVVKPLYATAIGKWRRYEEPLAPIASVLEPWAERFGYET